MTIEPLRIDDIEDAVFRSRELIDSCAKSEGGSVFPRLAKNVNVDQVITIEEEISMQALLFIHSPYKFHWLCAGIGVGKSYILARYVLRRVCTNWETVGLLAANTHDQLTQSTLPHLFKLLAQSRIPYVVNKTPPESWGSRNLFERDYRGIISIKVADGKVAHVLTRTLNNSKAIRGITIGWAATDEISDTKKEAFEEIKERLRCELSHKLQFLVVGMPELPGNNWTWEMFNPKDPETQAMFKITFQSSTEAKHLNWKEYLKPLLMTLDPIKAMQRVFARIVEDQSGRAYYAYKDGVNNIAKYQYNDFQDIFLYWDFNILSDSPISLSICQEFLATDGVIEVQAIDEISMERKTTVDACREFLARYGNHRGRIWVFGDNTAGLNRSVTEFQHIKLTLLPSFGNRLVIPKFKSNPQTEQRIGSVNFMLRNSFGRPRLFINPETCPELIEDMRKLVPKGTDVDKSDKKRSHMSDALGYGIWFRFPPFDSPAGSREIEAYV